MSDDDWDGTGKVSLEHLRRECEDYFNLPATDRNKYKFKLDGYTLVVRHRGDVDFEAEAENEDELKYLREFIRKCQDKGFSATEIPVGASRGSLTVSGIKSGNSPPTE